MRVLLPMFANMVTKPGQHVFSVPNLPAFATSKGQDIIINTWRKPCIAHKPISKYYLAHFIAPFRSL
jgi:hypothetical protein